MPVIVEVTENRRIKGGYLSVSEEFNESEEAQRCKKVLKGKTLFS